MPYYRKRKRVRSETRVYVVFSILMLTAGLAIILSLLSSGLLGLGLLLVKIFPTVTVFQATMIPLSILIGIGLCVTIVFSVADLKDVVSYVAADHAGEMADPITAPNANEEWRYKSAKPSVGL